ncbi:MAG: galactose oxidase [Niabella sp.]
MAIISCGCNENGSHKKAVLRWLQLPQVPDPVGFAGAFAGTSHNYLLVAGGANFPEGARPWSGGVKQWNDKIFALHKGESAWKEIGKLPRPMGYGISLDWNEGILLIGGADQEQHYHTVYFLKYDGASLHIDTLAPLPKPLANSCGAIVNKTLYVAGGLSAPSSKNTEKIFLSLALDQPREKQVWRRLQPWPGESRMLSVAGVINNEFYLISGASLEATAADTAPRRKYLTDAYIFNPSGNWRKIKDLPYPVTAAPTPAYTTIDNHLLIFGGDDGRLANQNAILKDTHPGFRTEVLDYGPAKNEWNIADHIFTDKKPDADHNPGRSTWAPVTTPLVVWGNCIVLPQGEVRPGVRTNRVLGAIFK